MSILSLMACALSLLTLTSAYDTANITFSLNEAYNWVQYRQAYEHSAGWTGRPNADSPDTQSSGGPYIAGHGSFLFTFVGSSFCVNGTTDGHTDIRASLWNSDSIPTVQIPMRQMERGGCGFLDTDGIHIVEVWGMTSVKVLISRQASSYRRGE